MEKKQSMNASIFLLMSIIQGINAQIDYCTENPNHLLCNIDCRSYKRGGTGKCKNYEEVSFANEKEMKSVVQDAHNFPRADVTSGQFGIANGDVFPIAKDMKYLKWDDLLYCSAKVKADQCTTKETDKNLRKINGAAIGEAIIRIQNDKVKSLGNDIWHNIMTNIVFTQEKNNFPLSFIDSFKKIGKDGNSVANLGQILSSKIYLVGCAASSYSETKNKEKYSITFVCHYGPEGLVEGSSVYEIKGKSDHYCGNQSSEIMMCKSGKNYAQNLYPPYSGTIGPSSFPSGPGDSTSTTDPRSNSALKNTSTGSLFVGVLIKFFF